MPIPPSAREKMKIAKRDYSDRLIDELATIMISRMTMTGIDISDINFQKRMTIAIECIRATLYASFNIKHPLQPAMYELLDYLEKRKKH